MKLLPDTVCEILESGCGLTIDASGSLPETLKRYAASARIGNAHLTLVNIAVLRPDTMKEIGRQAQGHVTIDLVTKA